MKKALLPITILLLAACTKHDETVNTLNASDMRFVTEASLANGASIAAAQMVAAKTTNPAIASFSQATITLRTEAQEALSSVADELGMTIRDSIDGAGTALLARLQTLEGHRLDTAYLNAEVRAAQTALSLYQAEFNDAGHMSVKGYTNRYLTALTNHLLKADSLRRHL